MAVFLIASHGFQRAEHTEFALDRNTNAVRQFNDLTGDVHVVFKRGNGLAIGLERTIHHHR